jgi:Fur family ferric uptake transcriptional regulator/Fur family zinc uptake transcriptional regulator
MTDYNKILERAGLRPTDAREAVLETLYRIGRPASHGEVAEALRGELDRVTIYRNLYLLEEAGLAHKVQGVDGKWRFCAHDPDVVGCPGDQPHFVCLSCGKMICLLGQALPHVDVPNGVKVQGKQLVVYGLCPECCRDRQK